MSGPNGLATHKGQFPKGHPQDRSRIEVSFPGLPLEGNDPSLPPLRTSGQEPHSHLSREVRTPLTHPSMHPRTARECHVPTRVMRTSLLPSCRAARSRFTKYLTIHRKIIVTLTYDSDLQRAETSFGNIVMLIREHYLIGRSYDFASESYLRKSLRSS